LKAFTFDARMHLYTTKATITITCPKRLAPYLEQEVKDLGFELEDKFVTGVEILGTLNDCIKLNLNLRCASQVLYSLEKRKRMTRMRSTIGLSIFPGKIFCPMPVISPLPVM